ncbi:FxsA protein affecting phage T7 exclusion by the F plasmid [Haemophilus parahaemolyticus]|uniref:FxsA protein affecting phage T7 exclusion by the F plasmid n=1 Tax=Haemophilus parahaemolyticus TaxID=735 RepID=A0A377I030_HAEPH|nr:FxsA protein affecting phage T7 exclusion by the F plasmid [Haemophilus parahaemolyticus]
MPLLIIFFALILYIYCELSLLVSVSTALGVFPTLFLLIAISVLGVWLVKLRGLYTMLSIRQDLTQGKLPTDAVINSVLFIIAGILLIIPGFISDILAILCVLPFTRKLIKLWGLNMLKKTLPICQFQHKSDRLPSEREYRV